VSDAGFTELYL